LPCWTAEAVCAARPIRGAQIIITGTKAPAPVVKGEWTSPVCTILANSPEEIDQATYLKSKIITIYNEGILTHVPPFQALVALVQSGKISEAEFSTESAGWSRSRAPATQLKSVSH
jgi:ornithine cyclodeaminase/alanine dehydrogenase-like protein (mu-crystallin family)